MLEKIIAKVHSRVPLVHSITNYVTANDCANIILACGGSPIMADDIGEVCDITSISSALSINIGTLNERTIKSMFAAGKKANELLIPIVFDPVGAGASNLRNTTALRLIDEIKFSVICGNISEIKFLATGGGNTNGVNACSADEVNSKNLDDVVSFAKSFSQKTGAVIAITGAIDIIADKNQACIIKNGHPMMNKVTGTGCMVSSVIATYVGANHDDAFKATVAAICAMGRCGEMAFEKTRLTDSGTGSYRTFVIDFMSKLDGKILKDGAKIESK